MTETPATVAPEIDHTALEAPDGHEAGAHAPEPAESAPSTRELGDAEFSCFDCGVGTVADPAAVVTVGSTRAVDGRGIELRFTQCPECRSITELARRAIEAHQSVAAALGPGAAVHRLNCGLLALDAIGQPLPAAEKLTSDRAVVLGLIRHLGAVGAGAKWVARFAPVLTASPGVCASSRWSHLREPELAELPAARAAYVALLAERLAAARQFGPVTVTIPTDLPDPDLRACLLCGVDSLLVEADEVRALGGEEPARTLAWRATTISTPTVVGAPPSPDPVRGWLCCTCAEAVGQAGAIGAGAIVIALRRQLRATGRDAEASLLADAPGQRMIGAVGWAGWVLRERRMGNPVPGPNPSPWDHVQVVG